MKSLFLISAFMLISLMVFSQVAPDKYWVIFTDKNNSPYSLEYPSGFLSQKAIDRREKQGIEIVENDLPVNPQYIEGVEETGVTVLTVSKWLNSVTIYTTNQEALAQIESLPYVQSVQISSKKESTSVTGKTSKPFFDEENIEPPHKNVPYIVGNSFNYGFAYNQISMLNGDALHNLGFDGNGMIIAVLDAGFLNADTHDCFDSLWINDQILGAKDFVSPFAPDIYGSHFHGTAVLSTMGANLPGNMVGTAPNANYLLLRSEDGKSEYIIEELNWVSAAEYADSAGADIINSSLGYTVFDAPFEAHSHTYQDMDGNTAPSTIGADIAVSKGMIVCNSAGNSGSGSWFYIGAPADGHDVFSVGAVDPEGYYASFSSNGPTYDGRIKPNVVAQGQATIIIDPWSGSVSIGNGTSFSSPVTSGMVACLWQAHPDKSNFEIMESIQQSASNASQPDNKLGYGIPNYLEAHYKLTGIDITGTPELKMIIHPNPFTDQIIIAITEQFAKPNMVELANAMGKTMYKHKIPENTLSNMICIKGLDYYASGIYVIKVYYGSEVAIGKIVKY